MIVHENFLSSLSSYQSITNSLLNYNPFGDGEIDFLYAGVLSNSLGELKVQNSLLEKRGGTTRDV